MDIKLESVDEEYNTEGQSVKETWFEVPIESSGAQENFKDESFTSNDVKSIDDERCDEKTDEISQRKVYDASFEMPDVGCSYSDRGPPNKFDSSKQANVKREESPSTIYSAASLSLPHRQVGIIKSNVKKELSQRELVAVILLERRTFHKRNFVCGFCFDIFSSKRLFKHHNLSHYHDTKDIKISNECENSLSDENDVQQPVLKRYKCGKCSFKTADFSSFKKHKKTHSEIQSLKCDQCSYSAVHLCNLKQHQLIHSGEKPFKCNECSFKTAWLNALKRHKIVHSGVKSFQCEQCSFSAVLFSCLKRHKIVHSNEKPFNCDQCSFKTAHSSHLKNHKSIHSGEKPFKCDQCSFSTVQLSFLKRHKLKHLAEKTFNCSQCSFKTAWLCALKRHESVHSELKPFKCDQCSFSTVLLSYLKKHKIVHSNEKPFFCDQCSFQSAHFSCLKKHKKTHSGKKNN